MKMKPASILAAAEIGCHYYARDGVTRLPAVAAFVTEASVRKARENRLVVGAVSEIGYGDLIVVRTTAEGGKDAVIQPLGSHGAYFIDLPTGTGPRPIRFTGPGMLAAREALIGAAREGVDLGEGGRNALAGIEFIFGMATSNPDIGRYGVRVVSDAFLSAMFEGASGVTLPVSEEAFARKARADLIRAEIAMMDPGHRDALTRSLPLVRILEDAGAKAGSRKEAEEELRRAIAGNDAMSREVFGLVTRTRIEDMSMAVVEAARSGELAEEMEDRALSGPWVDALRQRLVEVLGGTAPGQAFAIVLATREGRDVLMVSDGADEMSGSHHLYSWPTADRYAAVNLGTSVGLAVSPEEIPDEEELARLAAVLEKLSDQSLTSGFENYA